jgi:hypothetical protein
MLTGITVDLGSQLLQRQQLEKPHTESGPKVNTSTYYKFRVNPNRNNIKKLLPPHDVYSTTTFNIEKTQEAPSFPSVFIFCTKNLQEVQGIQGKYIYS